MTLDEARRFALALPETSEEPHHERTSFRVRGKIFATALPDGIALNVLLDEPDARAAVHDDPEACEELWWGKQIVGVKVRLAGADQARVEELLTEAWLRRAPKALGAQFDQSS
jgi:hypothetical protein